MVGNAFVVQALELVGLTALSDLTGTLDLVQPRGIIATIVDAIAHPSQGNASAGVVTFEFQPGDALMGVAVVGFVGAIVAIGCSIASPGCRDAISTETFELIFFAINFGAILFITVISAVIFSIAYPAH